MSADERSVREQTVTKLDETQTKLKTARDLIINNTLPVEKVTDLKDLLEKINFDDVLKDDLACW